MQTFDQFVSFRWYYYERSFLIVLHNVWSTGPGRTADLVFELRTRIQGWQFADRHCVPEGTNSRVLPAIFPGIITGGDGLIIAIDVHKRKEVVCETDDGGKIVKEYEFENTEEEWKTFMDWHRGTGARIALESSTTGKYAARLLRDNGFEVHMANPRKMKAIYESYKKTDRNDARILAKKLREGELPESYLPPKEIDDIRSMVRYRRSLGEEITAIKNRVHAMLARYGITVEASDIFGKKSLKQIQESAGKMRPADGFILADLMQRFHDLSSRSESVETQLASMGKDIPEVKKLMTIPGIGSYSALAIYSEIGEISRFPDARHLSAYCGLVPRVDQSGDTAYYGHITKSGPSILRFFLVNSIHTTVKVSKTFKTSYRKLKKRIGKNKAIVAMARKLAVTIYNMLAKNQDFVDISTCAGLGENKADRMQSMAKKAQTMDSESVKRLIDKGVIRLQSNKLLS